MEVYILDNLLRRSLVIDRFESLIWTERQKAHGDFELVIHSTSANRNIFTAGTRLALNDSLRVMQVETCENSSDSEGRSMLSVKGRSLEFVLQDRVAMAAITDFATTPTWDFSLEPGSTSQADTPGNIAREIFQKICVEGMLSPADIIPFITPGTIFAPDTIEEPSDIIEMQLEPTTVYDAIVELCEVHGLGFRLVRNHDLMQLHFDIYTGRDRTSKQRGLPAVIFSADLDNLEDITEYDTSQDYKNVAYVYSKWGSRIVYALGSDPTTAGFERRVLLVKVDSELQDGEDLMELLLQKGKDELAKHRRMSAFDGEVTQFGSYKYGVDYELGDLVEMRSTDGVTTNMRVTEQIFVSDAEGERSYPTLAVDMFVMAGTWVAWDYEQVWSGATKEWENA